MSNRYSEARPLHRAMRRTAATRPASWFLARTLHHLDRPVYRITHGRTTVAARLTGLPVVMLTTTGKKSGRLRTVPLVGFRVDGSHVVIASNFGRRRHPSWYLNLRENPRARLSVDGITSEVEARELAGAERDTCFEKALELYPGYVQYRQRARRRIPVISLETSSDGHGDDPVGRLGDAGDTDP